MSEIDSQKVVERLLSHESKKQLSIEKARKEKTEKEEQELL
jgi:hypothetical protein